MRCRLADCVFIALFAGFGAELAVSAPTNFRLLSLIPPGAQIVAGFETKQNPYRTGGGSLLLITQNNVLDLFDWVALSGVDPKRASSEILYVSFAPPGTTPREHLLLVTGRFDRQRIFRSAEQNGAKSLKYLSENILAIEPFTRERLDMAATRWLAILEDRFAVFGTPWMVQQALNRFENGVVADPVLMDRLALFHSDINCWNVVTALPKTRQTPFLDSGGPWSDLFADTELLLVGVHADSKVRVDMLQRISQEPEAADFNEKAAQFTRIFFQEAVQGDDHLRRVKSLQADGNGVRVSLVLPAEDFLAWKNGQLTRDRQLMDLAHQRKGLASAGTHSPAMAALPNRP